MTDIEQIKRLHDDFCNMQQDGVVLGISIKTVAGKYHITNSEVISKIIAALVKESSRQVKLMTYGKNHSDRVKEG